MSLYTALFYFVCNVEFLSVYSKDQKALDKQEGFPQVNPLVKKVLPWC